MHPLSWLHNQLEAADTDLLRETVTTVANQLMSAHFQALCGAPHVRLFQLCGTPGEATVTDSRALTSEGHLWRPSFLPAP